MKMKIHATDWALRLFESIDNSTYTVIPAVREGEERIA
jgi:hypothetical protein